jgi:hypothetical protein
MTAYLTYVRGLQHGWLNGRGLAPSSQTLAVTETLVNKLLIKPQLNPYPDGSIELAWFGYPISCRVSETHLFLVTDGSSMSCQSIHEICIHLESILYS